jgi:hypothetical protein
MHVPPPEPTQGAAVISDAVIAMAQPGDRAILGAMSDMPGVVIAILSVGLVFALAWSVLPLPGRFVVVAKPHRFALGMSALAQLGDGLVVPILLGAGAAGLIWGWPDAGEVPELELLAASVAFLIGGLARLWFLLGQGPFVFDRERDEVRHGGRVLCRQSAITNLVYGDQEDDEAGLTLVYRDGAGRERRCAIEQRGGRDLAVLNARLGEYLWPSRIPPLAVGRWRTASFAAPATASGPAPTGPAPTGPAPTGPGSEAHAAPELRGPEERPVGGSDERAGAN